MTTLPPTLSPSPTTCDALHKELQIIWDEIGENDRERDRMLLELEQECLDIYRRKADKIRRYKADLHQQLADSEAEIVNLISALGEHNSFLREKGTLKEQLFAIKLILEELRAKKQERVKEFSEIQSQIVSICAEIAGNSQSNICQYSQVNEQDLTVKKLGEVKVHLQGLQNEKIERIQKVNSHLSTIHELSIVLSIDFIRIVNDIHPSLGIPISSQSKSVSNDTLVRLTTTINSLKQEKQQRLQKLQDLGRTLVALWKLMDTPDHEQKNFDHVVSLISSSVDELSRPGSLALEIVEQTKVEVERLNILKSSKMKELVFKRQNELEEIYKGVHMEVDHDAVREVLTSLIDSAEKFRRNLRDCCVRNDFTGNVDLSDLLSSMDDQIVKANEQALSRKDILEKVEKWNFATNEEKWLDEYERDKNRYSAGRGEHKNLKRAEKSRGLVGKIPSIVESLSVKVKAWEMEKGVPFLYNKASLLQTLGEYAKQRQEKEDEKRRSREQKRVQEQLAAEQEALFGSRPAIKKPLGQSTSANTLMGTPGRRVVTPGQYAFSGGKERRESSRTNPVIPLNFVALRKDDSTS